MIKTHPESIWIGPNDIENGEGELSYEPLTDDDVEYVHAAAYLAPKAQLVEAWFAGYVAGQECSRDGVPRRNPFSVVEKGEKS